MPLTREAILRVVKDPVLYERGISVYHEGRVESVTPHPGYLEAAVRGSADGTYYVHIQLQENGDPRLAICTCPYFPRAGSCKHVAAVLLHRFAGENPEAELSAPPPAPRPPSPAAPAPPAAERERVIDLERPLDRLYPIDGEILRLRGGAAEPGAGPRLRPREPKHRLVFAVEVRRDYEGPHWTLAAAGMYLRRDGLAGKLSPWRPSLEVEPATLEEKALFNRLLAREGASDRLAPHLSFLAAHRLPNLYLEREGQALPLSFEPLRGLRLRFRLSGLEEERPLFEPVPAFTGEEAPFPPSEVILDGLDAYWIAPDGRVLYRQGDEPLYRLLAFLAVRTRPFSVGEIRELQRAMEGNSSGIEVDFRARKIRLERGVPRHVLELEERRGGLHLELFHDYGGREVSHRERGTLVGREIDGEEVTLVERDLREEARLRHSLVVLLQVPNYFFDPRLRLPPETGLQGFLLEHGAALLDRGVSIRLKEGRRSIRAHGGRIALAVRSGIDWLDLQARHVDPDGRESAVEIDPQLLSLGLLRVGDTYTLLSREDIERLESLLEEGMDGRGALRVSKLQVGLIDRWYEEILNRQDPAVQTARQIAVRLRDFQGMAPAEPPVGFRGQLRDYQAAGLSWLLFLHDNGLGGCLADDMGLGKTVQALAFLQALREREALRPSLILVPVTTLANWESEIRRFTPQMDLLVHHGQGREADGAALAGRDLVLTSYHTLRRDIELFRRVEWRCALLDESQAIKNAGSQLFKAVRLLAAGQRLSLTGTPIENGTFELWSQMEFLNPGLLGGVASFRRRFTTAIEEEHDPRAAERLRRLVHPFILRRRKEDVARELPPKTEVILYSEMDRRQRALYEELRAFFRRRVSEKIAREGVKRSSFEILTALLRLRQAALFPGLVEARHERLPSCKFEQLKETVEEVLQEGHKVLIFSQFVEALGRIRAHYERQGTELAWLDGSTPAPARREAIERFNGQERVKLFLLSLKAGGTGINLTAADYVILYDPWWNPAVESQAIDRSHRIGQRRKVIAYRMIVRDTIEEKIQELQARKKGLTEELLASEAGLFKSLNREDILALMEP